MPLDAVVIEGHSSVDSSALTGESLPREVNEGDTLLSGCVNINGLLTAQVTKEFAESTASRILDLVENAGAKKSRSENFITKFARYYTPIVEMCIRDRNQLGHFLAAADHRHTGAMNQTNQVTTMFTIEKTIFTGHDEASFTF